MYIFFEIKDKQEFKLKTVIMTDAKKITLIVFHSKSMHIKLNKNLSSKLCVSFVLCARLLGLLTMGQRLGEVWGCDTLFAGY